MGELLRLLQIEDSASDAALVVRMLEKAQYQVEWRRAQNAAQVRAALAEQAWDVIIADYHLPQFDAPAALRILHESGQDIPFIVVSGVMGEGTAVEMMKAGAHDYLLKSNLARLVPAVEREIRDARTRFERRRAEEALRDSERSFRELADLMPQLVWVADETGAIVYVNRQWSEQIGAPFEQSMGDRWQQVLHPDDLDRTLAVWRRSLDTGGPYQIEYRLRVASGEYRWFLARAVPVLDERGRTTRWFGTTTDIEDTKKAEERMRQSQKMESIGLLAGGVAHDFNNLLTVIMGNATAALEECPGCQSSKNVVSASQRAAYLTSQLLAYAGKGQFITKTFNLSNLVSRAKPLLAASVPKRVSLFLNLSQQEQLIEADYSQVEQIVMNLVINAGEAIPPKSDGRIEIATSGCEVAPEMAHAYAPAFDVRPGRFVCLEVADNGSGMDGATRSRIFDPFFTTKFTGRGLGLAAVFGIVRGLKGSIDVVTSPGAGTTFRVYLPAAATQRPAEIPVYTEAKAAWRTGRKSATILVIDDEDMVRKLACMALRSRGYEVLEAEDGKQALELLAGAAAPPALALVDLAMPVMGGDELVPILEKDYPGMKIVVTSGYPEEEARKGFPLSTVAGFLAKPYTVSALAEKLEEALSSGANSEGSTPSGSARSRAL